jgi:anhydro-N-acetylmuramic acid kinase
MLNEWVLQETGDDCDRDGKMAMAGKAHVPTVEALLHNPYFARVPPKSLDRNHFPIKQLNQLTKEDGAATLVEFFAETVKTAATHFPQKAKKWLICGGGRHNPAMMQALKKRFVDVQPVESVGWDGDAIEAQAFAFLAVRSLLGKTLTLPSTTGVSNPTTGGAFYGAG